MQTFKKQLEEIRLEFEKGNIERWNPDLDIGAQAELLPYDSKWDVPRIKLKLGNIRINEIKFKFIRLSINFNLFSGKQLGSGAFGVVYKAEAKSIIDPNETTVVAVKMVKPSSDASHTKSLVSELKIMTHIGKHLNIVNLLGACTENITTSN